MTKCDFCDFKDTFKEFTEVLPDKTHKRFSNVHHGAILTWDQDTGVFLVKVPETSEVYLAMIEHVQWPEMFHLPLHVHYCPVCGRHLV